MMRPFSDFQAARRGNPRCFTPEASVRAILIGAFGFGISEFLRTSKPDFKTFPFLIFCGSSRELYFEVPENAWITARPRHPELGP
jgi:hypothetical protein